MIWLIHIAVGLVVFVAMFAVGLDLTRNSFARAAGDPVPIAAGLLGPLVLLPLLAWGLAHLMGLGRDVGLGLVLVAACPPGALANLYTAMGRGNAALSVLITAVATLTGVVTVPLAAAFGFRLLAQEGSSISLPLGRTLAQLIFLLLLPVLLGMALRAWKPRRAERCGPWLRNFSFLGVFAVCAVVVGNEWALFTRNLRETSLAATSFTLLAAALGWGAGLAARLGREDRVALSMVFSTRSLGLVILLGLGVLGRAEVLVFAAAFFAVQAVLAGALAAALRGLESA